MLLTAHEADAGFLCGSLACRRQLASKPHQRRCEICGTLLATGEVTRSVCASQECEHARTLQQMTRASRAKALDDRNAVIARTARAVAFRNKCAEQDQFPDAHLYGVAVVPFNKGVEEPLAAERREAFREHLAALAADAVSRRCNAHPDDAPQLSYSGRSLSPETQSVMIKACMLCRGNCCSYGDTHAYLGWNTLLRYVEQHPDHSADDVVASYMSHVGALTLSPGCVYQASDGCTLPRDMRSDTCNNFLCGGLEAFLNDAGESAPVRAFIVPVHGDTFEYGMFATEQLVQLVHRAAHGNSSKGTFAH